MPRPAIMLAAVAAVAAACTRPFVVPRFATEYQPRTRVVAVAPLANHTTVRDAPAIVGEALYLALRDHDDEYTVTIQNERETKRLIREAGVTEAAAALLPTTELCRTLQADAIVRGTITSFLQYRADRQVPEVIAFGDATGSQVNVEAVIYDCRKGERVWAYKIRKTGGFLSSPEGLRERVGGELAQKFPYKRKD